MSFSSEVREARQKLGMTQSKFGKLFGTSQGQISFWERNMKLPTEGYQRNFLSRLREYTNHSEDQEEPSFEQKKKIR